MFAVVSFGTGLQAQGHIALANESVPPRSVTQGGDTNPLHRKLSIVLDGVVLKEALRLVGVNGGVKLSFGEEVSSIRKMVTLRASGQSVGDILDVILQGTDVTYRVTETGQILLVRTVKSRGEPGGSIKGQVVDSATGKGVRGGKIEVYGAKLAALTDEDGRFVLPNVPNGTQTITIKLLGYKSVTRQVKIEEGRELTVRIVLAPTPTSLSGVVTTATGVQRKLEIGNSIASINVDSVMRVTPITTLTDLLETRVPGLTVQRTTGTPGDPARIRIRGSSSIERSNEPIVIVDGIRMYGGESVGSSKNLSQGLTGNIGGGNGDLRTNTQSSFDQIDPNSIETIDVFNGPSAAAMYGSDAAAGVIVITTKRGRAQAPRWTFALNSGIETLPGKYPIGTYRFGHSETPNIFGNSLLICARTAFDCVTDSVKHFQALNDSRWTVIGRGSDNGGSLTTSGGVSTLQYSISASYGAQTGMLQMPDLEIAQFTKEFGIAPFSWMRRPEHYNTWGVTGTLSAQPSQKTSITLSSVAFSSKQQRSYFSNAVRILATSYIDESQVGGVSLLLPDLYRRMTAEARRTQLTAQMLWTPVAWLPLNGTVGLSTTNRSDETLVPNGFNKTLLDSLGRYAVGRGSDETRSFNLNTSVTVPRARVTIATGLTGSSQQIATMNAQADTIPQGAMLPTVFTLGSQSTRAATTYGWFVEPRLNLSSRFFVMPGLRLDNNGLAGSKAGIMGLPKMNFSWIASDESFFPWKQHVNLLRLRAAFGASGVQPGLADRGRTYLISSGTSIGGPTGSAVETPIVGGRTLQINGLGNTELRPERSLEFEGGFDTDFWNDRIHLDFTGYRKTKRDAIITSPLAGSLGGKSVKINIGQVRNTGFEVSTTLQLIERKILSWNTGFSVAQNDNVVVRLNPGQSQIAIGEIGGPSGTNTLVRLGYPLFGRWVRPILGYADVNHNGILEKTEVRLGDSMVYMGRQEPDYTMTATSVATLFGRITVNVIFDYVHGITLVNNLMSGVTGAPSPFGADQSDPLLRQVPYAGVEAGTPYGFVQTVSTLRFNTLSFSYNVPQSVVRLVQGRSILLSLQGRNLGVKTNYRGKDPQIGANATGNSLVDQGAMPLPRTFNLRVQIGS